MRSGIRPNSYWGEVIRQRVADQVDAIKHWKIFNKSYEESPDLEATWFIDPPYQGECGKKYRCKLDQYTKLGEWCLKRRGQAIVCERAGADWLPFRPFQSIKATPGARGKSYSEEVIWTN
jgi:16S rRNA G966 N2-methylase RsmD